MSEWWTYRLSDFLLFSPRTYYRLFELYNADVWPGQLIALGLGATLLVLVMQGSDRAARAACVLLAACWLWVAWAYHLQRYAGINWAAAWFAAAFAIEALLLLALGGFARRWRWRRGPGRAAGIGLLLLALFIHPALGWLFGRPWQQAEVFGLAPDPTVLASLGLLLLLRADDGAGRAAASGVLLLWPIPVLWCLVSGATLWAMQAPDALLMPAAAAAALAVCASGARAALRSA